MRAELACKQGEGKERERGKREPVRMAEDFDFQVLVIHFMFKLTIQLFNYVPV